MVGNYPYGALRFRSLFRGERADVFGNGAKDVRVVYRSVPVQRHQSALQSHAGVDVFLLELRQRAVGMFEIVHEHVVPYLHEPAAVVCGRFAWLGLVHDKYLGVLAARTRRTRDPPIVLLVQVKDPVLGYSRLAPKRGGLFVPRAVVVALEHRYRESFFVDPQHLGQKFVRPRYRFALEIISERPIAEHLEEGAVRVVADGIYVAGPDAFLHVGEALAAGVLLSQKIRHQRLHPRGREQHRRVVFGYK